MLLSFLMLSRMLCELLVAHRVAELLAALDEQHLVDHVDDQLRRHIVEHLPELGVGRVGLQIRLLPHLAERGDLAGFEVGLGEDLAIHLDENLLDDFGARRGDRRRATASGHDQRRRFGTSDWIIHG